MFLWTVFFVLTFRLLRNSPFTQVYVVELLLIVGLGLHVALYGLNAVLVGRLPRGPLWWLTTLTAAMALWSATAARLEFGQPLHFGALAQLDMALAFAGLFLYLALRRGRVTLAEIERVFLLLAWSSAVIYLVLGQVLDPRKYIDMHSFVSYSEIRGGYLFNFNVFFIIFGTVYYFIKSLHRVHPTNILAALFFLSYLVLIHKGRSILLALAVALVFMVLFLVGRKQRLRLLFWLLPIAALVILSVIFFGGNLVESYSRLFASAFTVLGGAAGNDVSANARLLEIASAANYIEKNPITGSGELSHQWNGGFRGALGYFYPSDIGLVGVVFIYGVLGAALLHAPYLWILRYAQAVRFEPSHAFPFAIKIFSLFFFLNSLVTGITAFYPGIVFILLAILAFSYEAVAVGVMTSSSSIPVQRKRYMSGEHPEMQLKMMP